jgi:tetratricopeptide (TPR) repeat protein
VTRSDVERARHAYGFSRGDPARAIREAEALLEEGPDVEAEIIALSAIGLANRMVYAADVAIEFLERAADLARAAGNDQLLGETLRSLAFDYAGAGDIPKALDTVATARSLLNGEELLKADLQHAFILGQAARYSEAIAMLDDVCERLDVTEASLVELVYGNRGSMHLVLGRLDAAIEDLETVYECAVANSHPATAADAALHLARAYADLGRMPQAMQWQGIAGDLYDTHVPDHLVGHMERADVLIAAGLYEEATTVLTSTIPRLVSHQGNDVVVRSAYLRLIDVHMRAGRPEQALRAVEAAGEAPTQSRYALDLSLAAARVRLANGVADEDTFAALLATPPQDGAQEGVDAMHARLAAVPLAVRMGYADTAARLAAAVDPDTGGTELSLLRSIAAAALAETDREALSHLETAADVLDVYRASVGATELRLLAAHQGKEIARLAIDIALELGDIPLLFRWLEWVRAGSLTLERLAHTQGVDTARVALRKVAAALIEHPDSPDLRAEVEAREAELAAVARMSPGDGSLAMDALRLESVVGMLGERTLVMFVERGNNLAALVAGSSSCSVVELGAVSGVTTTLHHLVAGVRRLARGAGTSSGIAAAGDLVRHHAERLRVLLIEPIGACERLLIVPSPSTDAVPWSLLTTVPVEVTPAVQTWLRRPGPHNGTSIVVAGPRLTHAEKEVVTVAEMLDAATVRTGDEFLATLADADVVHVAAHAMPRFGNPMFSSLELADGPIRIYDIESVGSAPRFVALAACEGAATTGRPGADVMSLGSAFLGMGTINVVAPLFIISDALTALVVDRFYRAMSRGLDSAQALAEVVATARDDRERLTAASFVSLGRAVVMPLL